MRNQIFALRRSALALAVAMAACAPGDAPQAAQQGGAPLPEGHPDISALGAPGSVLSGVVQETMDGGGYTFVRMDTGTREVWAAGPVTAVAVGDQVSLADTMAMPNFNAPSLDRTFEVLYFTGGFNTGSSDPAAAEFQGVVTETINSAGYTYINVTAGDQSLWLAAPEMEIPENATIAWNGGMRMVQFNSPSLNRSWDEIYFVDNVIVLPAGQ